MIFCTVGGLGLFLFGMKLMSDGLRASAGRRLKGVLESMTKRAFVAFAIGAGVTALIQSSSAATVMVIGFVNAGLLTLKQAICVIIGTNVGTTATAWLVSISGIGALKITTYALPAVGLGFFLHLGGRTRRAKHIGQIFLGFGILFIGIGFMKEAFEHLENSARIQELFATLGQRPLLAIIAGTVVTMLIQSSSATIAILQLLAIGGAFSLDWQTALDIAIPFVLGSNIGTTITAQLAALQTNVSARRAAWAHTVFNVAGVVIVYPCVHWRCYGDFVTAISPWALGPTTIAMSIAVAHTLFQFIGAAIWLPLAGMLERLVVRIVHERPGDAAMRPIMLEKHLLDTPEIALQQTKREIVRMAKTAKNALCTAIAGVTDNDARKLVVVREIEDFIDSFQLEITSYLSALSSLHLSEEVSVELPVLLHTVNDLERIGDHAVNIVEIAERKMDYNLSFSESALSEADRMKREAVQMFDCIIAALRDGDEEQAKAALTNEKNLNRMQIEFRRSHVDRMREGVCTPEGGLVFIDLVDNIEKVGDHLTNIAQAVIGGLQWAGVEPKLAQDPRFID
ncbi:MAG: Na/Pi cotransporter family protein [Candidatus Krumholzibacteria bacterium]|jgi:phosphate:Na+ symporter|nr:Na/Pi cotransporter family protein [Candidatus Krumholzibacteria bacterium]